MKTVMLVLLQSFILTVFVTAMAKTFMPDSTTHTNTTLHVSLD